jgi:hypothetical protein
MVLGQPIERPVRQKEQAQAYYFGSDDSTVIAGKWMQLKVAKSEVFTNSRPDQLVIFRICPAKLTAELNMRADMSMHGADTPRVNDFPNIPNAGLCGT